jgi:hypothetical protein
MIHDTIAVKSVLPNPEFFVIQNEEFELKYNTLDEISCIPCSSLEIDIFMLVQAFIKSPYDDIKVPSSLLGKYLRSIYKEKYSYDCPEISDAKLYKHLVDRELAGDLCIHNKLAPLGVPTMFTRTLSLEEHKNNFHLFAMKICVDCSDLFTDSEDEDSMSIEIHTSKSKSGYDEFHFGVKFH